MKLAKACAMTQGAGHLQEELHAGIAGAARMADNEIGRARVFTRRGRAR